MASDGTITFDAITLVTHGGKIILGPPADRSAIGALVGVSGAYAQTNPIGPRTIHAMGMYRYDDSSDPAVAVDALKAAIEQNQRLLVGTVATLADSTNNSYANCKMVSLSHGPLQAFGATNVICTISAAVIQLSPAAAT